MPSRINALSALSIPRLFAGDAHTAAARDFRGSLAARWGVPADHILPAGSGSAALHVLLRGLARSRPHLRGVALPAWGGRKLARTVLRAGLEPVYVDVDPGNLGFDPGAFLEAREARDRAGLGLLAVILAHPFALRQPIPPGHWEGTAFLRDCTQDFDHRPEDGLPCIYSFGPGTALNAGHGGALCVPGGGALLEACRAEWAALPLPQKFRRPGREQGDSPPRLEGLSPGFDRVGAAALEAYTRSRPYRRGLIRAYRAAFSAHQAGAITLPALPALAGSAGSPADWLPDLFPVLVRDAGLREALLEELGGRFGGVARPYPVAPDGRFGLPNGPSGAADFPGARRLARELIALPVEVSLRDGEGEFLGCLEEILEHGGPRPRRTRARVSLDPIPDAATEDAV